MSDGQMDGDMDIDVKNRDIDVDVYIFIYSFMYIFKYVNLCYGEGGLLFLEIVKSVDFCFCFIF